MTIQMNNPALGRGRLEPAVGATTEANRAMLALQQANPMLAERARIVLSQQETIA